MGGTEAPGYIGPGLILLPLNCMLITRDQDRSEKVSEDRVAIRFNAEVVKGDEALLGYKSDGFVVGRIARDFRTGDFGAKGQYGCRYVVGTGGKTRTWQVYFPQSGL